MKNLIKKALDDISWHKVPEAWPVDSQVPTITHEGFLTIGPITVKVVMLSNGKRVVPEDELLKIFRANL